MKPITSVSDPIPNYAKALDMALTLPELLSMLKDYESIAADALAAAPRDEAEFATFRVGLTKERRGKFCGVKWSDRYGAVLIPKLMLKIDLIAQQYKVPWGLAYIRYMGH